MDEINWPELARDFNPTPYYAVRRNRLTQRNNDLCPMCLAPKTECWKVEGPEDLTITTGSGGHEGVSQ